MIFVFSLDLEVLSLSGSHGGATTEIEEVGLENELQRGQGRKKKRQMEGEGVSWCGMR